MTQVERIKKYLEDFGSITQLEALRDLGIMRLGARIWEMDKKGEKIGRKTEYSTNRYGQKIHYTRYYLTKDVA